MTSLLRKPPFLSHFTIFCISSFFYHTYFHLSWKALSNNVFTLTLCLPCSPICTSVHVPRSPICTVIHMPIVHSYCSMKRLLKNVFGSHCPHALLTGLLECSIRFTCKKIQRVEHNTSECRPNSSVPQNNVAHGGYVLGKQRVKQIWAAWPCMLSVSVKGRNNEAPKTCTSKAFITCKCFKKSENMPVTRNNITNFPPSTVVQWNLFIRRSLGPWKSPCYIRFLIISG